MPKEANYPCLGPTTHFHKLHLNFHFFHLNYIIVSVSLNLPHLHYLEASWNLTWNPSFTVFQHDFNFLPKMCVACLLTSNGQVIIIFMFQCVYWFHPSIARWKCINHFFKTNSYYFEIKQCFFSFFFLASTCSHPCNNVIKWNWND